MCVCVGGGAPRHDVQERPVTAGILEVTGFHGETLGVQFFLVLGEQGEIEHRVMWLLH